MLLTSNILYFNPLPPHGGRQYLPLYTPSFTCYFNPLPPHGGRHCDVKICLFFFAFQSTPSAWRETLQFYDFHFIPFIISIHSLRMEGDLTYFLTQYRFYQFQSTPSAWRETSRTVFCLARRFNFNPLPPHGGRPYFHVDRWKHKNISIHSLRMEGDPFTPKPARIMTISIHSLRMEGDAVKFMLCP